MKMRAGAGVAAFLGFAAAGWAGPGMSLWSDGQAHCRVVLPTGDEQAARLAGSTLSRHMRGFYGHELPQAGAAGDAGNLIVIGNPQNNPLVAKLVGQGVKLTTEDLGDEGFQILTHQSGQSRYVIINGRTPRALKHGCQELLFYRMSATKADIAVDWPLDVVMKPEMSYRGIYILPCWAAHDSIESWRRVLQFSSEITLNRNWFWLDGFPVAGHTGEYGGTPLANDDSVQSLIDLCNDEQMKFLIGGGWFTWHHKDAVGEDLDKGLDYYRAYLKAFKGFHGFYFEPTGEGSENENWRPAGEALRRFIPALLDERPDLEFAVAIGKFNNAEYLRLMAELDPKRVYWWWCWGDPYRDKALDLYPSIVRWHTNMRMSNFHGSTEPPLPSERTLAGVATSYDPGQGFGNPWNGWAKLRGVTKPRDFDPRTIPYFAHQYHFRERCWDLKLSDGDFVKRLHRRLFDADAPKNAGELYWALSQITLQCDSKTPSPDELKPIRAFLDAQKGRNCTPRMIDTLARMEEAAGQLARLGQKSGG